MGEPPTSSAGQLFLVEIGEPEELHHHAGSSSDESDEEAVPPTDGSAGLPNVPAFEPGTEEVSLSTAAPYTELAYQVFTRPKARGRGKPQFQDLDAMSFEEGRHRLIHVDLIHPYHKNLQAGYKLFLLTRCYKTGFLCFQPVKSRAEVTNAFGAIAIEAGWHKLPYVVTIVSDGEPALVACIREACVRLCLAFSTTVPNRPNTNPAGSNAVKELRRKVNCGMLDASRHGNVLGGSYEAIFFQYYVNISNVLANRTDPRLRSPFELIYGIPPVFDVLPIGQPCYMPLTAEGRRAHILRHGRAGAYTAEPCLYLGKSRGHHRALTLRGTSRCGTLSVDLTGVLGVFPGTTAVAAGTASSAAINVAATEAPTSADAAQRAINALQTASGALLTSADHSLVIKAGKKKSGKEYIQQRCDKVIGMTVAQALQQYFPNSAGVLVPYRRCDYAYDLECQRICVEVPAPVTPADLTVSEAECIHNAVMMALVHEDSSELYNMAEPERRVYVAEQGNIVRQQDLSWKQFLAPGHPRRADVIAAYNKELDSIINLGVMVEIQPGTARYAEALVSPATTVCKVLLGAKRDLTVKVRIVVRGDMENKEYTDGIDFNYYACTASWTALRMLILQSGMHVLEPGQTEADWILTTSCDVETAFCQSHDFGDGVQRTLKVKSPVDGVCRYYDQLKPLYGSCSAPRRWQDTIAEFLTLPISEGGPGLVRGHNAPAVYHRKPHSDLGALTLVIYVDDILLFGKKADQLAFYIILKRKFKCKEVKWLTKESPLDHLGVTLYKDDDYIWMSMENYITNMLMILNMPDCIPMYVPFVGAITDMKELCADRRMFVTKAVGMLNWLSQTVRGEIRFALSRISQHLAKPNQGMFDAVVRLLRYLATTRKLALRQELNRHVEWQFYCDSDMAGNAEPGNKRRSQLGYIGTRGQGLMICSSRVSSVQFGEAAKPVGVPSALPPVTANAALTEEHVANSSAEAEIYSLGTFANEILALSYVAEEAGIPFPRPAVIHVDNAAALAFSKQAQYAGRSKLRHIDCKQQWVQVLRDSNLIQCVHVSTEFNTADIMTKPLDTSTFERHRDAFLHWCPH